MNDTIHVAEMGGGQNCLYAPSLAMAYAPNQEWNEVYALDIGLCRGTIFPSLDKPFIGKGCLARGRK